MKEFLLSLLIALASCAAEAAEDPELLEAARWLKTLTPAKLREVRDLYQSKIDVVDRVRFVTEGEAPGDAKARVRARYEYVGLEFELRVRSYREARRQTAECARFFRVDRELNEMFEFATDRLLHEPGDPSFISDPYTRAVYEAKVTVAYTQMAQLEAYVAQDGEAYTSELGDVHRPCVLDDRPAWKAKYLERFKRARKLYSALLGIPGIRNVYSLPAKLGRINADSVVGEDLFDLGKSLAINTALASFAAGNLARGFVYLGLSARAAAPVAFATVIGTQEGINHVIASDHKAANEVRKNQVYSSYERTLLGAEGVAALHEARRARELLPWLEAIAKKHRAELFRQLRDPELELQKDFEVILRKWGGVLKALEFNRVRLELIDAEIARRSVAPTRKVKSS